MNVAFVDTETTGLDPERNPIWEIAVIIGDGPSTPVSMFGSSAPRPNPPNERQRPSPATFVVDRAGSSRLSGRRTCDPRSSANVNRWVLDNTRFADDYDHDTALRPDDSIERFARLVEGRHLVGRSPRSTRNASAASTDGGSTRPLPGSRGTTT